VNQVKDPAVAKSLRLLWDEHYGIKEQTRAIQATQDAHDETLTSLGAKVDAAQTTATQAMDSRGDGSGPTGTGGGGGDGSGDTDNGQGELGCGSSGSTGHVTTGSPLTAETMGKIVCGTAKEFPALGLVVANQGIRDANRHELLGRMIWHLTLAGFTAAYYPGNPFVLLIKAAGTVYGYRVTDYANFDVQMFSLMLFLGFNEHIGNNWTAINTPDGGIAD
jgi:hypothetical protein